MKNNSFIYALAAGSLLLGSCSSSDDTQNGEAQNNEAQQIVLQVANAGDGLTTRAGRPLESSEAAQDIRHVKVMVCGTDGTIKYTTTIDNWDKDDNGVSAYSTANSHGRQTTITIPTANHLPQGTYTVYAIGYSDPTDYDISDITNLAAGNTFSTNAVIKLSGNDKTPEEIFAGSAQYTVTEGVKAEGSVVLNRQVAGSFGYVEDIPYADGATALQLVASTTNTSLVLGNFANNDEPANNVKYVVNGTNTATDKHIIYTINLNDWFTNIEDTDGDGLIDAGSNWISTGHQYYKEGSAFAGNFVFPFEKVADNQTFTLRLVNASGDVLRSWNVNLPADDGQLTAHTFAAWNTTSTEFTSTSNVLDTKNCYSVVRNHLYGIGARPSATPDQPGTDPDKPQPLKKAQEITLKVNDNWEVIHKMEIE